MKKIILVGLMASAMALSTSAGMAADAVTLQLKWVAQAQFAGYFVAKDKGFYEEEGIDITIKNGGPDVAPEQVIAGGGADVIVDWMAGALAARDKGVGLVNIAQPFKKSGLLLICPKDGPVQTVADFPGHTLGVWFFGNEYPFYAWMNKEGIPTDGGDAGVNVLKQSFDVEPLIQGQADCISVMTYNELGQAIDAGFTTDKLTIFNYTEMGNDLLEDGLYAMEEDLADPAFAETMVRFVKASQKGWKYAVENPDEAAQIVIDNDESGAQTLEHQQYMMSEVAKLVDPDDFALNIDAYNRTEKALLDQKIIENQPEGAYTLEITDKAGM
ncbi:ABC transporter substrate-binding protein [Mariluticola halotolerans]|uniref:ABC transporter substrate-binding protein n=1 Tax=Mariluticola halotolerans TaxID=2909283 RepID=UPI0026E44141|nr:ABC transporter substrate-binding protein [Mariluticola halotolerans]UJQ93429.1 ABC transporter substrate-binding protein [Mariluticola halotolerans]